MKSTNRVIGGAMAALVLVGAPRVFAQDWPQWRGPEPGRQGDRLHRAPDVAEGADAEVESDGRHRAIRRRPWWATSFTSFRGRAATRSLTCLDAATGKQLWENKYAAKAVTGPAARHPGPRGSPAVAEGKVVTLGATGILSCLDAATGKELWRKDEFPGVTPKFFTGMSPIIVDGMAIAYLGGPGNGAIMAFDVASGDLKWKWDGEGPDYGSPVLMTVGGVKQLVTLTEKSLVGIALADGKLLWQVPFPIQGMAYNAATPIVDGDTVIYTGQNRGTKAVKIEKQGDGFDRQRALEQPASRRAVQHARAQGRPALRPVRQGHVLLPGRQDRQDGLD